MKKISLIVAMAENRVIGKNNTLPWRLAEDLKYFKRITLGHPVVMGRKTYESIGRPLPNRINVIVTRKNLQPAEGIIVCSDLEKALQAAEREACTLGVNEIMVIGGAQLYQQLLPRADRIYLTLVHANVEGDARFPEMDERDWCEISRVDHSNDTRNSYDYSFIVLHRKCLG